MQPNGQDRMMNSDLVSVVIPAFNAEATIDDTLRSVRSQTHRNLEIIVVDDGSTDETMSIAAMHASKDDRMILFSQRNAGVAAARNAGWQLAHSDFIAFVDADDLWAPTKIERQLEVMIAGGERVGLVYTWWDLIDEKNCICFKSEGWNLSGDVLDQILGKNFVGNGSSTLIRREALLEAGGYDSGLHQNGMQGCEDLLIYYRIARKFHFGLVPEYLTGYRVFSERMSSNRPKMFRSHLAVATEMQADYPDHKRTIDKSTRYYLRFLIGEAIARRNFEQVWLLLSPWVREHPFELLFIPLRIVGMMVKFHLGWMARRLVGHPLVRKGTRFPIGEPEETAG